jgi:hypothetical protein
MPRPDALTAEAAEPPAAQMRGKVAAWLRGDTATRQPRAQLSQHGYASTSETSGQLHDETDGCAAAVQSSSETAALIHALLPDGCAATRLHGCAAKRRARLRVETAAATRK